MAPSTRTKDSLASQKRQTWSCAGQIKASAAPDKATKAYAGKARIRRQRSRTTTSQPDIKTGCRSIALCALAHRARGKIDAGTLDLEHIGAEARAELELLLAAPEGERPR